MTLTVSRVCFRKMTTMNKILVPPADVRGMKVLDRVKFLRNVQVPVLKLMEQNLSKVIQHCKPFLLKFENFKPIQSLIEDEFKKCIYLNPEKIQCNDWSDARKNLLQYGCTEKNFAEKEVQLGYENWSYETIFKAVLPEGEEIVSSYSQIGHILHLNLRDHLVDYRLLIGQVLLDKIKTCQTVVNKSNIIDNTYRNFSMEVIAGKEDFIVKVKENTCIFRFDFSKVYWNPRLGKEHERILSYLKPGDILFDVFCGVGPFSVPAAKHKCRVFANDLNPESYKWLNYNAQHNKLKQTLFKSYNMDGKDFICQVLSDYLTNVCIGKEEINDARIHITMNLPAMAVEFIKYFKGLIINKNLMDKFNCDIIVYLYCFAVGEDPKSVAKQMINENMKCDMSPYILDIFNVRNVSPKKEMMRVTFKLTKEVIFDVNNDYDDAPPSKKVCVL